MTIPSISIVTPTYNQGQYIEQTIQSVLDQQYSNLEYIIIDGGSTDGTVEIIKKYAKHLKYWVSEADRGQAHAINKGFRLCTGDIFNWLNSDDYLAPRALKNIAEAFQNSNAGAVAGKSIYFDGYGNQQVEQLANLTPEGLLFWLPGVVFVQPGLWLKRDSIIRCGGIDEEFHYSFDTDMIVRYLSLFPTVKYMEESLVYFRLHPESKTVSQPEGFIADRKLFVKKISLDPTFKHLHTLCNQWLEKDAWSGYLKARMSSTAPKVEDALKVALQILKKPTTRFNRKSFGSIKAILSRS